MYKHGIKYEEAISLVEQKNPRSSMNRWQKASVQYLEEYIPRV